MHFLWPEALWSGLALPAVLLLYLWLMNRRRKAAVAYPNLAIVKDAFERGAALRRHVPPTLLLLALSALVVAGARPTAKLTLPSNQQTVVLAMDVSLSMSADDVAPNRVTASQAAAKTFAEQLPRYVRVGVVAYGGSAHLVQPPTLSREDVIVAIDRFQLQRATAIGAGIMASLKAVFPEEEFELEKKRDRSQALLSESDIPARAKGRAFKAVAAGSYESAVIILLTDGQNTAGPDPMDAAQVSADYGVKIFTIGFGTRDGALLELQGAKMRVRLDEDTMKQVANLTGGKYFHASSGSDLQEIYGQLKGRLVFERKEVEVTALFAMVAAMLMLLAAALSMLWFGRIA